MKVANVKIVRSAHRASRALVESLELRQLLSSTFVVNTTVDETDPQGSPTVSFRDALAEANASTSPSTITFDPTVFATAKTIVSNGNLFAFTNTAESTTVIGPAQGLTFSGNDLEPNAFKIETNVTVSISMLTVSGFDNSSGTGGFCAFLNDGDLTLTDTAVSSNIFDSNDNVAGAPGLVNFGTADIVNDTFAENQIYISNAVYGFGNYDAGSISSLGTMRLIDSTVSGNTDETSGASYPGGVFVDEGVTTIANSVVAGNAGNPDPDVSGSFNSLGNNLIGAADGSTGFNVEDLTGTTASPLNADLNTLANNAGPTMTLLPKPGSPLIDAGSNTEIDPLATTDQRGLSRIYNGIVDIGATETQPIPSISVSPPAPQTAITGQSTQLALGSFSAANTAAPYTVTVNFGDGTDDTYTATAAGTIAAESHIYSTAGANTVTVTVTSGATSATGTFQINAVTESIAVMAPPAQSVLVTRPASFQLGSFSQTATTGPYTVLVDWGDGSTASTFIAAGAGTLAAQMHLYATPGVDSASVTVSSSGGQVTGSAQFTVNVMTGSTTSAISLQSSQTGTIHAATAVTLTATLSPITAIGEVTFLSNGVSLGTPVALAGGVAVLTTASLPSGTLNLSASYSGSATFAASESTAVSLTVIPAPNNSSIAVSSSSASINTCQSLTFTAIVSGDNGSGPATSGTVTFYQGSIVLGTANLSSGGIATFTTDSAFPVGSIAVTSAYSGNAEFASSNSNNSPVTISIVPTPTQTTVSVSSENKTSAQIVTLQATVALEPSISGDNLNDEVATGLVTFFDNGTAIGTASVDVTGNATLVTSSPAATGSTSITASFAGDASDIASASANTISAFVTEHALVPVVVKTSRIPVTIIAGTPLKGSFSLLLTNELINQGASLENGPFTLSVFATQTPSLDLSGDPLVGTVLHRAKIAHGKAIHVAAPVNEFPLSLAEGTYELMLQTTDEFGNTETIDTGTSVNVVAPVISLSATFASVPANVLQQGALLSLINTGNVNDSSTFTAVVGFSTDAAGQNVVASGPGKIKPAKFLLRLGRTSKVRITGWQSLLATVPSDVYLTVTITDAAGNSAFAVSSTQI